MCLCAVCCVALDPTVGWQCPVGVAVKPVCESYGVWLKLSPYFTLFSRVCTTTPYLSSAKACTIAMGSDTSLHVLRFTGFDHRRERRRLE